MCRRELFSAEVTFKERLGQARYTSKVTKAVFLDPSRTICQPVQKLGNVLKKNKRALTRENILFCFLW